ncbi:MAG TPA: hypothetical protein VN541_07915 [Tepidisphaeraceae bacterium]|nr:hypothetical protein [Tepidisphaeraceae bacterium]
MSRRCRACGARVKGSAAWCSYCGERIYSRVGNPLPILGALGAFVALAFLAYLVWATTI